MCDVYGIQMMLYVTELFISLTILINLDIKIVYHNVNLIKI